MYNPVLLQEEFEKVEHGKARISAIKEAVKKADAKGAKDIVIFDSVNAFIVNVPNKTVVTTMSGSEMRDNVFTNIDGAVIA